MENKIHKTIYIIPITSLLLIALIYPLPYCFYTLNRILTTLISLYGIYQTWESKSIVFYALIVIAILFNPIVPIYLSRNTWKFVDLLAIIPFLVIFLNKKH